MIDLGRHGTSVALVNNLTGRETSYASLDAQVERLATRVYGGRGRGLVMLAARSDTDGIAHLLAAWRAGHAVLLAKPQLLRTAFAALLAAYQPDFLATASEHSGEIVVVAGPETRSEQPLPPALALVMSTSGSSGAAKSVRLSYANLAANFDQILRAMHLTSEARSLMTMPLHYTYGLSIILTHLYCGASLLLDQRAWIAPGLWRDFGHNQGNGIHHVPLGYQLLKGMLQAGLTLEATTMATQSGGPMAAENTLAVVDALGRRGRFFKMYGMTEATARVCVCPPEALLDKIHSVGVPVPGGQVAIASDGQVIYSGPNVMLGYATDREALGGGDDCGGTLSTGDLGALDSDGFLFLHGRKDREIKLAGLRLNLDGLEREFSPPFAVKLRFVDDRIVASSSSDRQAIQMEARRLEQRLGLPQGAIRLESPEAVKPPGKGFA